MCAPTTRHAEFIAPELAATERVQDFLDLAAEMRSHSHAALFQFPQKRFGKRSTEEHIHMQFCDASRHRFRWRRGKDEFFPRYFLASSPGDQKQTRSSVEHRRNALLRNGYSNCHVRHKALSVPAAAVGCGSL